MRSKVVTLAGVGAALLALAACGDDGASSNAPAATRISSTNFVTIPPVTTTTTLAPLPGETTTVPPGTPAGEQTYTVQPGDALASIARKHGVAMEAIVLANGWTDGITHLIYKGLVIKIPAGGTVPAAGDATSSTAAGGPTTTAKPGTSTTTAKPGTSTTARSTTAKSTTTSTTGTTIAGGQSNCGVGTYKIVDGDVPSSVAKKFGTTVAAMDAVNADTKGYSGFVVGITIKIPAKSDC